MNVFRKKVFIEVINYISGKLVRLVNIEAYKTNFQIIKFVNSNE